jgi:adenylate kinase family enzyme
LTGPSFVGRSTIAGFF